MANEYRGFSIGTGSYATPRKRRIRQHPVSARRRPAISPTASAPSPSKAV